MKNFLIKKFIAALLCLIVILISLNFNVINLHATSLILLSSVDTSAADECKLLANTLFYLKQWTTATSYTDNSSQDLNVPNSPTINISGTNITWSAIDNGTPYSFYVETYKKADMLTIAATSNTNNITVATGVKSYRYILDNSVSTTVTATTGTSTTGESIPINTNYKYLHVCAIDGAGNISETATLEIPQIASYKVIHQQEQLNGTYTTVETENLSGTIGSSVTPAVKSYTGFTSPSTQTVTISAEGSTTVTYKYTHILLKQIQKIKGI